MGDEVLMEEEKQRKFPIWAIVAIFAVIGLAVAGIVCLVLVKHAEKEDLRQAIDLSQSVIDMRAAVETYFAEKTDKIELTDEQKEKFEDFENAVAKSGDLMRELGEKSSVKDGDAKTKYEDAAKIYEKLQEVGEVEQILMSALSDRALIDEELDEFANGKNEYLKKMATEYKEYRTKVAEFNEKYADLKGKNKTELDADYAKLQQDGNELAKKYAEIKFEDVYGMSRDDILKFYATIEELNKILAEKN